MVGESDITVLHLAVDFNTPQRIRTTRAIEQTVDAIPEFNNVVVAYRRVPRPVAGQEILVRSDPYPVYDFPYFGLPLGVGLHSAMKRAAHRTVRQLERDGIRPSLVHAHKMTFEGVAGWYIARHYGVPLFLSMRGEVETKVFRRKPLMRAFLRRIARDARRHYFVSAWFRDEFHRLVPGEQEKERLLPNMVSNIQPKIVPSPATRPLVSVFNLDTWKRKGVRYLLDGFRLALDGQSNLQLEIIGGGRPDSVAHVNSLIAERGLAGHVRLTGPMPNDRLLQALGDYRALILPSLNETFGMVYVEALFAGIPVLFTSGSAIDGYLGDLRVARTAPPRDTGAIADAICDLWADNDGYRRRIGEASSQIFRSFDPEAAIRAYRDDIVAATGRDRASLRSGSQELSE